MSLGPDRATAWREVLSQQATSWSSPRSLSRPYAAKWQTLGPEWPRRLLHIPTMTSVERMPGDMYRGEHRPKYNILSYTWGRWEIRDHEPERRLGISGVSWTIPAVACFTAEEFRQVIFKMGETAPFAWVDIACIDQENYPVKMDEVGRQAGIFANAHRVYVWLWSLDMSSMESSVLTIIKDSTVAADRSPGGRNLPAVLKDVTDSVERIFGDWWFSSLWTLQEGVLRQDALFLSRDGQLLKDLVDLCRDSTRPKGLNHESRETPYYNPGTLSYLTEKAYLLYSQLTHTNNRFNEPQMRPLRDMVLHRLLQAGCASPPSSNPNVQYATAKHRQATNEADRIYGIMAVYGITVGAAAPGGDTSKVYSLAELENEFVSALNAHSPLLGQMFVHTQKPRLGKTWQVTQDSRFPIETLANYESHRSFGHCTISASPSGSTAARIGGHLTPLYSLLSYWRACEGPDAQPPGGFTDLGFELDDYLSRDYPSIPRPYEHLSWRGPADKLGWYLLGVVYRTSEALLEVFGRDRVSVLLLGTREGTRFFHPLLYGIVLLHDEDDWNSCQRLGLCLWPTNSWNGVVIEEHQMPQWTRYDGDIH